MDGRGAKRREGWRRRGNGVVVLLECGLKRERYGVGINGGGRHRHSQEAERERERARICSSAVCARKEGKVGKGAKGDGSVCIATTWKQRVVISVRCNAIHPRCFCFKKFPPFCCFCCCPPAPCSEILNVPRVDNLWLQLREALSAALPPPLSLVPSSVPSLPPSLSLLGNNKIYIYIAKVLPPSQL